MSVNDSPSRLSACILMQARDVVPVIQPIAGIRACGRFDQANGVVVMKRTNRKSATLGEFVAAGIGKLGTSDFVENS